MAHSQGIDRLFVPLVDIAPATIRAPMHQHPPSPHTYRPLTAQQHDRCRRQLHGFGGDTLPPLLFQRTWGANFCAPQSRYFPQHFRMHPKIIAATYCRNTDNMKFGKHELKQKISPCPKITLSGLPSRIGKPTVQYMAGVERQK
jgi:hypothetical protein